MMAHCPDLKDDGDDEVLKFQNLLVGHLEILGVKGE
jgi:hypothetical protein